MSSPFLKVHFSNQITRKMIAQLCGKESSPLRIFSDGTYTDDFMFHTIQQLNSTSTTDIIGLCYRCPPQTYTHYLQGNPRLSLHDCFSDPLSWLKESSWCDLKAECCVSRGSGGDRRLIFIDDLLLWGRSWGCIDKRGKWDGLIELLHEMARNNDVVAFVHPDLVSDANLRILAHISHLHTTVDMHPDLVGAFRILSVLRKPSGKVVVERKTLVQDAEGKNLVEVNEKLDNGATKDKPAPPEADPASNLTFNLRLTDAEKEARANTALPYLLNDSKMAAYLEETSSSVVRHSRDGGEVIYMPDEADDFDDEDPDDDLDF